MNLVRSAAQQALQQQHAPGRSAEFAAILFLGLPTGLTQLLQASLGFTDTVMLGRVNAVSLGASALGSVIFYVTFLVGFGPAMAVTPIISQAIGKDRNDLYTSTSCVRMALLLTLTLYPVLLCIHVVSPDLAAWLGEPPAVVRRLRSFVLALSPGLPFMVGSLVLRNFLTTLGHTRICVLSISLIVFLNALLNFLLIYGHGGFPKLGLTGSGLSTSIAYLTGFLILAGYSSRITCKSRIALLWPATLDRAMMRQVCRLGFPIGAAMAFEVTVFNASIFLVGRLGPTETAVYQIALSLAGIGFMIPLGFGIAGSIRVGLARGAGDLAAVRRATFATITLALATVSAVALPVYFRPDLFTRIYLGATSTAFPAVAAFASAFLPYAAVFMCLDVLQMAINQCLRGLKDVYVPTLLLGVSSWLIGLPIALYLGPPTRLGAPGVILGVSSGLASAAILLGVRLYLALRSKRVVRPPSKDTIVSPP